MGLLGGIIGATGQAGQYDGQKRLARARGKAEKAALYAQATQIEETVRRNAGLDRMNMVRMAGNRNAAVGQARVASAGSGFDIDSGTGDLPESEVREQGAAAIADAALSSSIAQASALDQALGVRRSGDAAERAANAEAEQYRLMAKGTRAGAWAGATLGAVGAVVGGIFGGAEGAVKGADVGWNFGASFNPFTARYADAGSGMNGLIGLINMKK